MKWKWADFWGYLVPGEKKPKDEKPETGECGWLPGGLRASRNSLALFIVAFLFLAFGGWIIFRVARFFKAFWGQVDTLGP